MTDRLTEIVREAWETGAHRGTFLLMHRDTFHRLTPVDDDGFRPRLVVPPGEDVWSKLTSIPVVLDNHMAVGSWRLMNRDGDQVENGFIDGNLSGRRDGIGV